MLRRCCGALLAMHLEGAVREGEACAVGALDAATERACEEAGVVLGREREQDAAALELQLRRLDAPPNRPTPRHSRERGRPAPLGLLCSPRAAG